MGVPEIKASNIAALMAAFRPAEAPGPATPVEPAARRQALLPSAPTRPAVAQEASIRIEGAKAAMARALIDAVEPRAPTPLRQGAQAYAAALANRAVELDALLAMARSVLDRAAPESGSGVRPPPDATFGALDRRALFAVASGLGGLFSKNEREGARNWLFQLAARILARLDMAATPAERLGVLAAFIDHLDGAGPEERATAEWVVQRAAAALGRDRLATAAGLRPQGDPALSDQRLVTVRAALEAPELIAMRLPEGLPPATGAREAPLLGTAFLTPDMLLVGLAAALRIIDRRRVRRDEAPPAGPDWRGEPDQSPEPDRDPDAADASLGFEPAAEEDGEEDWEDAEDGDESGDEDGFDPVIDR